jgi:hypothetical protein
MTPDIDLIASHVNQSNHLIVLQKEKITKNNKNNKNSQKKKPKKKSIDTMQTH